MHTATIRAGYDSVEIEFGIESQHYQGPIVTNLLGIAGVQSVVKQPRSMTTYIVTPNQGTDARQLVPRIEETLRAIFVNVPFTIKSA